MRQKYPTYRCPHVTLNWRIGFFSGFWSLHLQCTHSVWIQSQTVCVSGSKMCHCLNNNNIFSLCLSPDCHVHLFFIYSQALKWNINTFFPQMSSQSVSVILSELLVLQSDLHTNNCVCTSTWFFLLQSDRLMFEMKAALWMTRSKWQQRLQLLTFK